MVSSTQQTERVRARQHKNAGRRRKRQMRMGQTTPALPVHPAGYDPNAADALPQQKMPQVQVPATPSGKKA